MNELLGRGRAFLGDIAAAFDYLERKDTVAPKRFAVTGFCMGGALTFATACALPQRVAAAAPFYGGGIGNLLGQADRLAALPSGRTSPPAADTFFRSGPPTSSEQFAAEVSS